MPFQGQIMENFAQSILDNTSQTVSFAVAHDAPLEPMLTANDDANTEANDSARVDSRHSDSIAEEPSEKLSKCNPEEPSDELHEEQSDEPIEELPEEPAGTPDDSQPMEVVVISSEEERVDILTSIAESDEDSDDLDASLIKQYRLKECFVRLEELPPEAGEANHDTPIRSLLEQIQIFGSDTDESDVDEGATSPRLKPLSKPFSIAMHRICAHCPKSVSETWNLKRTFLPT